MRAGVHTSISLGEARKIPAFSKLEVMADIPYSSKFSRGPIFMVLADECLTAKIKLVK